MELENSLTTKISQIIYRKKQKTFDFGQARETSTLFSHGIGSIGFVKWRLKFKYPTGLGFVMSVERTPPLL